MPASPKYLVNADHVAPRFQARDLPVKVGGSPETGGYYASADGFGMGHSYPTIEQAIRDIFLANACTNIRIAPAEAAA